MLTTDAFWGVLWVQRVHGFAARGILLMVLFHVIGVLVASVRHRENLPLAMLNGHKRGPGPIDVV
jgi:cytochrome b